MPFGLRYLPETDRRKLGLAPRLMQGNSSKRASRPLLSYAAAQRAQSGS